MRKTLRVVVDTNVLVSAFITCGKPRELLNKLMDEHQVILSRSINDEFIEVFKEEKFHVSSIRVEGFLDNLSRKSKLVNPKTQYKVILQDPDDDLIVNTACTGKADYIVTGDMHLLGLKDFKRIKIVKVAQMLEILNCKGKS